MTLCFAHKKVYILEYLHLRFESSLNHSNFSKNNHYHAGASRIPNSLVLLSFAEPTNPCMIPVFAIWNLKFSWVSLRKISKNHSERMLWRCLKWEIRRNHIFAGFAVDLWLSYLCWKQISWKFKPSLVFSCWKMGLLTFCIYVNKVCSALCNTTCVF